MTRRDTRNQPEGEARVEDRVFDPTTRYGRDVTLDMIEIGHKNDEFTYLACDHEAPCPNHGLPAHLNCIVIAVDGACRGNGTAEARGAAGIFVGKKSTYNRSVPVGAQGATNQTTELMAGLLGLHQAMAIARSGDLGEEPLDTVVIKADSEYLVKGMTERVLRWERNGYRTSRGEAVKNAGLFRELQTQVQALDALAVEVLFWQVPRVRNQEADRLANEAFSDNSNTS
jgi:ribonuclease HI